MKRLQSECIFSDKVAVKALLMVMCVTLAACAGAGDQKTERHIYAAGRTVYILEDRTDVVATVWDAGEYGHVRIVKAEDSAQTANDHPASLTPQDIHQALSELRVQREKAEPKPVFTEQELDTIAGPLASALAQARPEQDVIFAVTDKEGFFGIFKPRLVTTGRVFYKNDQLNVIFGLVNGEFESQLRATGILREFTPGSRNRPLDSQQMVFTGAAMQYAAVGREDWIQIRPPAWSEPVDQVGIQPPPATYPSTQPIADTEPRTTTPTAPVDEGDLDRHYEQAEKRLKGLQRLRNLDLITEEEYQEKRQAILDEL